jgi:uncharacterized protein YgfB (UPF0149 family)
MGELDFGDGSAAALAEAHGATCGLLCTSGLDAEATLGKLLQIQSDLDALGGLADVELRRLYVQTLEQISGPELSLRIVLPDDSFSLRERVAALGHWCSGFLYGAALGASQAGGPMAPELSEFLEDLTRIARLSDYEDEDGDEESEGAYAEIVEYLRAGALLVYQTCRGANEGGPGERSLRHRS